MSISVGTRKDSHGLSLSSVMPFQSTSDLKDADPRFPELWKRIRKLDDQTFISPEWRCKKVWDGCIIVVVMYISVFVPLEMCFLSNLTRIRNPDMDRLYDAMKSLDWIADCGFIVDLVINFRTCELSPDGRIIKDSKSIAARYIFGGWFWIDFVSSIPLSRMTNAKGKNAEVLSFIKCFRLLRMSRLLRKFEEMGNANIARIIRMLGAFALIAHWVACGWFVIGQKGWCRVVLLRTSRFQHDDDGDLDDGIEMSTSEGDDYDDMDLDRLSLGFWYLLSWYWATTTLTTVGYGDYIPVTQRETLYASIVQLCGSVMTAVIFGEMAVLISKVRMLTSLLTSTRH
jgi:hypothetical protein